MVPPRSSHSPTGSPPARRPPGAIPVARGVHDRGQHPADPRRPVDPGDGHRVARGGRGGDRGVRLTILGGGGVRVPLVYRALLADRGKDRVTEVVLHDLDPGRIAVIRQVLAEQAADHPAAPQVSATTDLDGALTGAAFVFSAIRVGGLAGRVVVVCVSLVVGVFGLVLVGVGG